MYVMNNIKYSISIITVVNISKKRFKYKCSFYLSVNKIITFNSLNSKNPELHSNLAIENDSVDTKNRS